jgi:hypothetical protein
MLSCSATERHDGGSPDEEQRARRRQRRPCARSSRRGRRRNGVGWPGGRQCAQDCGRLGATWCGRSDGDGLTRETFCSTNGHADPGAVPAMPHTAQSPLYVRCERLPHCPMPSGTVTLTLAPTDFSSDIPLQGPARLMADAQYPRRSLHSTATLSALDLDLSAAPPVDLQTEAQLLLRYAAIADVRGRRGPARPACHTSVGDTRDSFACNAQHRPCAWGTGQPGREQSWKTHQ